MKGPGQEGAVHRLQSTGIVAFGMDGLSVVLVQLSSIAVIIRLGSCNDLFCVEDMMRMRWRREEPQGEKKSGAEEDYDGGGLRRG